MLLLLLACGSCLLAPARALAQKIDLDKIKADEHLRQAVLAYHNGLFPQSVLYLEKSLSLKPAEAVYRRWLGRALYRSGLEEAALGEWHRLLDSGGRDELLKSQVQAIEFRRGLGRAFSAGVQAAENRFVVAQRIDGRQGGTTLFARPSSVRLRPDGTLVVVSFGSNEIVFTDVNHQVRESWRGGVAGFNRPFDLVETGDGSVFISEYGADRIARCAADGRKLAVFGGTGSGPGQLLGPQYLAVDDQGYLYVTEWGNRRVSKYDPGGSFVLSFAGRQADGRPSDGRQAPGFRLSGPTGIAVQADTVYVADRAGRSIETYDLSGNHLRSIGRGLLQEPEGLAFARLAADGPPCLLVADAGWIRTYDPQRDAWGVAADLTGERPRLTGVARSPNGELYALDFDQSRIFVLSEMAALYSGLFVQVERVAAAGFPQVLASVSVQDRMGRPIVGLEQANFLFTEGHRAVVGMELLQRAPTDLEVSVVVEPSARMVERREELRSAVAALYDAFRDPASRADAAPDGAARRGKGALQLLSAGERPALEADFSFSRLKVLEAASRAASLPGGPFDLAVRQAAAELTPRHARRAVVYLSCGQPGRGSFREYSLVEVARYLANNGIAFYALWLDGGPPPADAAAFAGELQFIAEETGGGVYSFQAPEGALPLVRDALRRAAPLYTFRYTSTTFPEFGTRYIPLEVQVNLVRRNGRDELGYFAPLSE